MFVRLKTLEARWETVGVDRLQGLYPEQPQLSSNEHGSDTARFILRRDPGAVYPDLSSFTPCEIEENGKVIWSGRVWETPSKEGADQQISVEGRGWQYHCDDEPFRIPFANSRVQNKDARQVLYANLGYFKADALVSNENGSPVIGFGKGYEATGTDTAAVVYDLGPDYDKIWPYFFIELMSNLGPSTTGVYCYVRLHNSPDPHSTGSDFYDLMSQNSSTFPRDNVKYISTPSSVARRYISIFTYWSGGAATMTEDHTVRIRAVKLLGDTAYHGHVGDSQLRASDVIARAVRETCPQLVDPTERTNRYEDEILGSPYVAGYWRFETASPFTDHSGKGRTLTGNAGVTGPTNYDYLDTSFGIEEQDYQAFFNGTTGYASASMPLAHQYFSIEAIFQPAASAAGATPHLIAYVGDSGANGWGLSLGGGGTADRLYILVGGIAYHDTGITIASGSGVWWVNASLLIDGRFSVEAGVKGGASYGWTSVPATLPVFAAAWTAYVGGNAGGSYFNGYISEVAIFSERFEYKVVVDDELIRHQQAAFSKTDGKIQRTSFWIPDFPMDAAQTTREVTDAVNTFHDYIWKVDHEPAMNFRPKPSSAKFEVGTWSGAEFEDTSANSGEEIYNAVRIEGQDYLGDLLVIERGGMQVNPDVTISNPTFNANLTSWSVSGTGFTHVRDTVTKYAGGGALRLDTDGSGLYGGVTNSTFNGDFIGGRMYGIEGMAQRGAFSGGNMVLTVSNAAGEQAIKYIPPGNTGFWFKWYIDFLFESYTGLTFKMEHHASGAGSVVWIDSLAMRSADLSLPSRRGFIRKKILPIQAAITTAAANQIGDVWLQGHTSTPFKGGMKHTHPEGIRVALTGESVHPSAMLNETGERIRFTHRIDPDSGDVGREGMIQSVAYDGVTGISTIAIDNTRSNFDAMLNRYAAVVGNIR